MKIAKRKAASLAAAGLAAATLVALTGCGGNDSGPAAPAVQILSSKAEHVSGGNALIDITVPDGAGALSAKLNGSDVSGAFKADPLRVGHLMGIVGGMANGDNTPTAGFGDNVSKVP